MKRIVVQFSGYNTSSDISVIFFFFQAEDGIRDDLVTGVQTCALPITSTGIPEMLASNLSETGELRILDSLRVLRNLQDLRLTPGRYDEAALKELADLWNVGRLVTGTIRRAGERLRVALTLVRAGAGGVSPRP